MIGAGVENTGFDASGSVARERVCANCGLRGGDGAGGVHTGLDASEAVVRGGRLTEPVLFSNLLVAGDGKKFVRLKKSHEGLCRFLTGKGAWSSPLAGSTVFETLRVRHDEQIEALVAATFSGPGAGEPAAGDGEEDPMALLGIDQPTAFEPGKRSCSRAISRLRKSVASQQPGYVRVGLEPGYELLVLTEADSHCPPAIELTASSLWSLFRAVNADLDQTEKPPREEATASREPRGPPGKREYWCGRRSVWLQKEMLPEAEQGPSKRYKVLLRRGTPPDDGDGALGGSGSGEGPQHE